MPTGKTYDETDGQALNVALVSTVEANDVVYAEGWLGVSAGNGDSGDSVALTIARTERQFVVPSGLAVAKGAIVCIDTTAISGTNIPPDGAYNTSAQSATNLPLFKATAAKDANHVVTGILLAGL
ncbi:MAG TPA: hypothetical protein PLZ51_17420 [Aggregatilineales bacterium]|nr:hypothetical protein [Aggregatilineales bacterium]